MALPPLFSSEFPSYEKQKFRNAIALWFQSEFAQSKYPPGQEVSEACTLICLLVAQRISQLCLQIQDINNCPELTIIIAEAIIEGNAIHSWIVKRKIVPHPYLNAEEALKFGGEKLNVLKEWKFKVFRDNIDASLYKNTENFLKEWYKSPLADNLFVLLITCGRTVLLIFQQKMNRVVLFDSHGHNSRNANRGLVVAQSSINNLEDLCNWFVHEVLHNCYRSESNQYELACLYNQKQSNR